MQWTGKHEDQSHYDGIISIQYDEESHTQSLFLLPLWLVMVQVTLDVSSQMILNSLYIFDHTGFYYHST